MFNESQASYVIGQLRHLEEMFRSALDELDESRDSGLFVRAKCDVTPAQRQVLQGYLRQLRFLIQRFMQAQSLRDGSEPPSSLWSFQTMLRFAHIAAEEMRPQYLRGYGTVDPDTGQASEAFVAQVQSLLGKAGAYLEAGPGEVR